MASISPIARAQSLLPISNPTPTFPQFAQGRAFFKPLTSISPPPRSFSSSSIMATTRVSVAPAIIVGGGRVVSPLFGATFIFGGTCKKIFEGIIFTFINHPFDVGDKCIIQKNELEVKRMNVLATTFTVIGTKEEALYPNSALASIPIINLKGEPDPNDQIELTLDPSYTTPLLNELQAKILKFFEADKGERYNKDPTLEIKDIGKRCIRMVIQFQHVISNNETTHSQCLEKKRRQRSKLLIQLKQFTEEIDTGKKVGRTVTMS